jgi:uncharacterized membrane protein YgcG
MTIVRGTLLALLLLIAPAAALAEERILRFVSDVQIRHDASLAVTETIDVRAENVAINRGIFRDFPTRYRARNGGWTRVGFQFDGATLDGGPVPASVESIANGVRIRIGDPEKYVPVGDHRYVIRYRTMRQIGRFEGFDELYWNATGNGWQFPIDSAEARIRLPGEARFGQRSVYTGPSGSTRADAEVVAESPGDIRFRTTRPLAACEGMTVAVAFPKGIVGDPAAASRAMWWLSDFGPPIVGGLGLLGLLGFYFSAWKRAGRNPRAGTVVPLFSPPDGLSPAGMRFVTRMGVDDRAFAAALVDMGVRGHIRMVEEDGGWFSGDKTRIERLSASSELPPEEQAALSELAQSGGSILMDKKNHSKFAAAKNSLSEVLKTQFEDRMFRRNWGWALTGLVLFVGALWLTAAAVAAAVNGAAMWQVGVTVGCILFAAIVAALLQSSSAVGKCLLTLAGFVTAAGALAAGLPIIGEALNSGWLLPLVLPLLALPLVVSAFFWIAAPTREGRTVLDRIAGFKQYLSITERERLDRMTAPEDTPAIFERFLPYAIALGVENRWADRFSGVLAAAAAQGQQGLGWYSGSHSPWESPGRFAETVGSSLSSAISSASTAPGSSSGSGGGGSSGGGGGGGGGGGW